MCQMGIGPVYAAECRCEIYKPRSLEIVSNTQMKQTTLNILFILLTIGFVLYDKYRFIFFKLGFEDL